MIPFRKYLSAYLSESVLVSLYGLKTVSDFDLFHNMKALVAFLKANKIDSKFKDVLVTKRMVQKIREVRDMKQGFAWNP
eukprot:gene14872-10633_t